jgi:ABC-type multidrug transport system permease subunit
MILLGYAINTTVEHVPAVVYRGDHGRAAQAYIDAVVGSHTFDVVEFVSSRKGLRDAIVSGKARIGFDIPENFTADLTAGRHPAIGALVDGSDSAVAQVAYGSAVALAGVPLRDFSLLTALAIVGERERGTLDQLLVTPIGSAGLMLGKLLPYALVAAADFIAVLLTMRFVFQVPIAGNLFLLSFLSAGFLLTALGLGLFVSTIAQTQIQAQLMSIFLLLPSVLLSGAVFERSLMPVPMQIIGYFIPLTYYIEILRGIILRGAGLTQLWPNVVMMFAYGIIVFAFASIRFARTTR